MPAPDAAAPAQASAPGAPQAPWCFAVDATAFATLWQALGAQGDPTPTWRALHTAWCEPQRHYHTLEHLGECLQHLRLLQAHAHDLPVLAMALWFHDAVYDPRAHDNEARSAAWAAEALTAARVAPARVVAVVQLVLATCHGYGAPDTSACGAHDAALLTDIDLAILAAEPARFDRYEAQVRAEYAWVPDDAFAAGRSRLLRTLLAQPRLYSDAVAPLGWEGRARGNLARSLARLGAR